MGHATLRQKCHALQARNPRRMPKSTLVSAAALSLALLAAPAFAQAQEAAVEGRISGVVSALIGLVAIVIGILAVLRTERFGPRRPSFIFRSKDRAFAVSVLLATLATILLYLGV